MVEPKNYLIFGAASDLATAFVKNLNATDNVILVARDHKKLISIYGNAFNSIECDLKDEVALRSIVKELKQSKIKFDGVLCAVGSHEVMPLKLYSEDKFRNILEDNFFTVANILRNISSILNSRAGIVLLSSAVTNRGAATVSAYAAAKSAIEGLTKAAALEFASKSIRVNSVAPGVFRSKMSESFLSSMSHEQAKNVAQAHPLGIGTCEQVSNVIKFLISDEASWVTGQTIIVDGGYSINA